MAETLFTELSYEAWNAHPLSAARANAKGEGVSEAQNFG